MMPIGTYRYKYMSDTVLLSTVFMFQVRKNKIAMLVKCLKKVTKVFVQ